MSKAPALVAMLFAICLVLPATVEAQDIQELQFINQPITDILIALGEIFDKSILPDETVEGSASYYIAETDFDTALAVFLDTQNLYVREEGGLYYVSSIRTDFDSFSGTVSMDAEDVQIRYLVRSLSEAISSTILYDSLPPDTLSIHVSRIKPEDLIAIFIKKYPDLELEIEENYYYIKRVPVVTSTVQQSRLPAKDLVTAQAGKYTLDVERSRFVEVIDAVFRSAGVEYSLLTKRDAVLENLKFENKTFAELLRLVLEQASADYATYEDIYYVFDITEKDVLKKLKTTVTVPLAHIAVQNLPNLLPPDLLSARFYKIDVINNAIILNGSIEEIAPVQSFISKIDRPVLGQQYFRFDLNHIKVSNLPNLLPDPFKQIVIKSIPGSNSIVVLLSPERAKALGDYLKLIDTPGELATVHLRYLKSEDLLAQLPPSITKEDIVTTADPSIIFLRGTPEKIDAVYRELEVLDRPTPQIKYHILVVQYAEGEGLNWDISLDSKLMLEDDTSAFLGTIGRLLSLNFDIVSAFGYLFAVDLNLDMSTNDAHILADTTLHGVSGQEIKFQNTETYRYREIEIDEEGNQTHTGVTREISAGLIFSITGWASGDGVVTMAINATVSKRGTDVSGTTASLPPTSENVINTQIRTRVGEPVVIGGLIRQEKGTSVTKVPLLGDIPLLGLLFQSRKDTVENSELAIYILPHIDYGFSAEEDVNIRLDRIYERFGRDHVQ